ncbi:MAG: hypothetical protein ACFFEU_11645 [Candidatus Thorarchaeota archaeon]
MSRRNGESPDEKPTIIDIMRGHAKKHEELVLNIWENAPEDLQNPSLVEGVSSIVIEAFESKHSRELYFKAKDSGESKERERLWIEGLDLTMLPRHIKDFSIVGFGTMEMKLDLRPLIALEHLKKLELVGAFEGTDVSPLGECSNLRDLDLNFKIEGSLEFLARLRKIERIRFRHTSANNQTNLKQLSDRIYIRTKQLNHRINLEPLSECHALQHLNISCEDYVDLRPLEACAKLVYLHVTGVIGLHLLSSPFLRKLDLSNGVLVNPWESYTMIPYKDKIKKDDVLDLRQLDGCESLERIDLSRNYLRTMELDIFREIEVGGRRGTIPMIDLRTNPLIAVYLPDGLIPKGHRIDDYLRVDSDVPVINDFDKYGRYIAEQL